MILKEVQTMWKTVSRIGLFAVLLPMLGAPVLATEGVVSTVNSSTATLTAGSSFTGPYEEVLHFDLIRISVTSDQDGADDGAIFVQFSSDAVNADCSEQYSYYQKSNGSTTNGASLLIVPKARYFRIKYTNGTVNQTTFRLVTIYQYSGTGMSWQWGGMTFPNFQALPSAARTTTQTLNVRRWGGRGILVCLAVTSFGASTTINIDVNMTQAGGGVTNARMARLTTVVSTNQMYFLIIYPGSSGTPDVAAQEKTYSVVLPSQVQIVLTPSNANANTYEMSYQDLP